MPIPISDVISWIDPDNTVLLFGSGSSIPSGAPAVKKLIDHYAEIFKLPSEGFGLSEISMLAEQQTSRRKSIQELRKFFKDLRPTGGISSLPLYNWKSIYTTNYDHLIEDSYKQHGKKCRVYSSNFDFGSIDERYDANLYKIHGTIERDTCDGWTTPIILTEQDYELTSLYREQLYDRLKGDVAGSDLIIIGQSLTDPHLSDIVNRACKINETALEPCRLTLLLYTPDDLRASLYERRGLKVAYSGIDEFFTALHKKVPNKIASAIETNSPIFENCKLGDTYIDVSNDINAKEADISSMFSGWPASYADIAAGYTFERDVSVSIAEHLKENGTQCAILLGAAGVGKSTAARQAMQIMQREGIRCWEHQANNSFDVNEWRKVGNYLKDNELLGCLLVDEADTYINDLSELSDLLVSDDNPHLKVLIVSTKGQWKPRSKSPNFYNFGREFSLSRLSQKEIDRLLNLIDNQPQVKSLVERTFSGFSRVERRRRLVSRCESDMFVCLKNIFASESFDDIILREYATLPEESQGIYRYVAAMENAGVKVHRQLVIRLLDVSAKDISSQLLLLDDIVQEFSINAKYGIYGWRCRHQVISAIVTKYKFNDIDNTIELFDQIIDCISPTYDVEIATIRGLCNLDGGISRIPDIDERNRLLRKMISIAPGERVPRHRLIRNLIQQGYFERAETEIRVFNKDFGSDGPVHRYKIQLKTARAKNTPGILEEDRIAIMEEAHELAAIGAQRYPKNRSVLGAYAELGLEYLKRTGSHEIFDEAIEHLKSLEALGDPDVSAMIARFERRIGLPND